MYVGESAYTRRLRPILFVDGRGCQPDEGLHVEDVLASVSASPEEIEATAELS